MIFHDAGFCQKKFLRTYIHMNNFAGKFVKIMIAVLLMKIKKIIYWNFSTRAWNKNFNDIQQKVWWIFILEIFYIQNQSTRGVLQKRRYVKFIKIPHKAPLLQSLFQKSYQVFPCEFAKFHTTPFSRTPSGNCFCISSKLKNLNPLNPSSRIVE